jgi:hypothetical protein
LLIRICRGRSQMTRGATFALKFAAEVATFLRTSELERFAYSGLFNLQYYYGLLNELGDRNFLFKDFAAQFGGSLETKGELKK